MDLNPILTEARAEVTNAAPKFAVIIPTFNEMGYVTALFRKLEISLSGRAWEATYVDDDSTDGTTKELLTLTLENAHVRVIHTIGRRGLSSAVVEGMFATSASYLAVIDADICVNLTEKPADASLRGVFHCAGAGFASWADVAATTFEASSIYGGPTANVIAIPSSDYPTPARRPLNSRLDTGKLRRSHGIAQPDWRNAVSRCVRDSLAPNELSGGADVALR